MQVGDIIEWPNMVRIVREEPTATGKPVWNTTFLAPRCSGGERIANAVSIVEF